MLITYYAQFTQKTQIQMNWF